jgi:pimeloyl-ACP methyl ester carboxylesterase
VIVYLHGFASGPSSRKAGSIQAAFAAHGAPLEVPDLTPGADGFERSTPLSMLDVAQGLLGVAPGPHALIGSSLGGYLSALLASRDPRIARLVLLAPAFRLFERWHERLTAAQLVEWRVDGLEVDHHATLDRRRLGCGFHQVAAGLPAFPEVKVPALVIAGRRDDVIPVADIEAWVARTPTARLLVVDDGHDLAGSLDLIVREAFDFLGPLHGR